MYIYIYISLMVFGLLPSSLLFPRFGHLSNSGILMIKSSRYVSEI